MFKFRLYPQKEKKQKNSKKKNIKPQQSEQTTQKANKTNDIKETLEFLNSSTEELKRLLKKLVIDNALVKIEVGGEDAAEISIEYGKTNAYIYSIFGIAKTLFSIKKSKIDISFNYEKKQTDFYISCDAKIRLISLILIVISLALKYNEKGSIKNGWA